MRRARRNLYALKRERREKREYTVGSRLLPNRIGYVIGTLIFWVTRFSDNNVSKYAICMIWDQGNSHLQRISSNEAFTRSQNAPKSGI